MKIAKGARARARALLTAKVGLFVVATGLLTALIGAQIARISFEGGWELTATFDDASGLMVGDEVKIAGAPVGRVDELKIVKGQARATLRIRESVSVSADSEAAIRWRDAIGRRVVYLLPGTQERKLRPGAHITRTHSVVDATALIDQLAPLTRSIQPEHVNRVLVSVAQTLDGNAPNLDRLVADVDTLSSTIAARRSTVRQMLADYATLTEIIARRDKQIGKAVDDLVTLSGAFVDNRKLIDGALVELATMARTSDQVLTGSARELDSVLTRMATFSGGVHRNQAAIVKLLDKAAPKLQNVFAATDNGGFMEVAVPCLTLVAPPCPYPMKLPGPRETPRATGQPSSTSKTSGGELPATTGSTTTVARLDSTDALRRVLVGG